MTQDNLDFVGREVYVVTMVEAEPCQCDIALNAATTIARLAGEMSGVVGVAGSSPGAMGCGCGEGMVCDGVKGEAASFDDRLADVSLELDTRINGGSQEVEGQSPKLNKPKTIARNNKEEE
ncbi:hypothetical protein V6N13_108855 [Hibiscus sabdariffa]|uniref:Uncharacterized protein n=1 Tax=Hibiscus sabdariffa TaxID=183260 RepID=A0ABR2FMZ5_9ROSI